MIRLEPMGEQDFTSFFEHMIKEYARESVESGKWNESDAINRARTEVESNLPAKHKTSGHYLFKISQDNSDIGYIWAGSNNPETKNVFVYAFEIYSDYRRQGSGTKSFQLLENEMKKKGFEKIILNVFENSEAAIKIYKNLEYKTRSRVMVKELIG